MLYCEKPDRSHDKLVFSIPKTQTSGKTGCEDSLVFNYFAHKKSSIAVCETIVFLYSSQIDGHNINFRYSAYL